MFNENVRNNALAAAVSIAASGRALNPMPNTFLDTLVTLAKNQAAVEQAGQQTADLTLSESPAKQFNAVLDELVTSSAQVLLRTQNMARTDAVPMIRQIVEQLGKVVNPDVPYAYTRMAVDQFVYPEIWSSDYLRAAAKQWRLSPALVEERIGENIYQSFEEDFGGDFLALSKTGLPEVDRMIGVILANYSVEKLREIFNNTFISGWVPYTYRADRFVGGYDAMVLVHIWATNLKDSDKLPSKTAYSKVQYLDILASIIAATGKHIGVAIDRRASDIRNERLVLEASDSRVLVNGDVYQEWLKREEEGACAEVLLGATVDSADAVTLTGNELLVNAGKYLKRWNSYVTMTEQKERESLKSTLRSELFRIMADTVRNRVAEGYLNEKDTAFTKLDKLVRECNLQQSNPYYAVRGIVLELFFCETDVGDFVCIMDELAADDKTMTDPEDLAVMATIYHVARWIAKFILDASAGLSDGDTKGKQRLSDHNTLILAAAATLANTLIRQVLGKQVGKTIAGNSIKDSALSAMTVAAIKNALKL